jgi:hypothetical protein
MPGYYLHPGESQFKTIMIKPVYDECYAFNNSIDTILKLILFFSDGSKVENVDSSAAIQSNCTWHQQPLHQLEFHINPYSANVENMVSS